MIVPVGEDAVWRPPPAGGDRCRRGRRRRSARSRPRRRDGCAPRRRCRCSTRSACSRATSPSFDRRKIACPWPCGLLRRDLLAARSAWIAPVAVEAGGSHTDGDEPEHERTDEEPAAHALPPSSDEVSPGPTRRVRRRIAAARSRRGRRLRRGPRRRRGGRTSRRRSRPSGRRSAPSRTTGRSPIRCSPTIATSGWLISGVTKIPPSLPALVIVIVASRSSSTRERPGAGAVGEAPELRVEVLDARDPRSRGRPGRRARRPSAPRRRRRRGRGGRSRRPRAGR